MRINGISGSDTRYGDKEWLGFWGEDIEITIDLDEEQEINNINTRFHNGNGQWIYAPRELHVEIENEVEKNTIPEEQNNIVNFNLSKKVTTKKIVLKIKNYGMIPEGKQGAGNPAWTFIDEIIIN